jgi:hypothetical protein
MASPNPPARDDKRPGQGAEAEPSGPRWAALGLGLGLVAVVGLVVRMSVGPDPAPPAPSGATTADESARAEAPPPPRCKVAPSTTAFVIGEPPAARVDEDAGGEPDDIMSPFGVELGRGAAYSGGFAVGVLHEGEGGMVASVAKVDADGHGELIRLARSRGDVEAPVVVGHGASLIAGMLEPNAGGRSLKISRIQGKELTWGPEIPQGRDESMAFDLAVGDSRGVAVWDDVGGVDKKSRVMLATFDPTTMRSGAGARPISPPAADADSPRVIARPGGFWLAYLAHGDPGAATPTPKDEAGEDDRGEVIASTWLEIVPLDAQGDAVSLPQRATPKEGHILAFDLLLGNDGAALVAYRDDDAPSGSAGGSVGMVTVQLGGIGQPRVVAEDGVGVGVPSLLTGWVTLSSLTGPKRLGPIDGAGAPTGALDPEPAIGLGEPLVAADGRLMVATPAGKAIRLSLLACDAATGHDGGP